MVEGTGQRDPPCGMECRELGGAVIHARGWRPFPLLRCYCLELALRLPSARIQLPRVSKLWHRRQALLRW